MTPASDSCVAENVSLGSKVRKGKLVGGHRKATATRITTGYNPKYAESERTTH